MVEHNLAKVGVASSNLVSRSKYMGKTARSFSPFIFCPGCILAHRFPMAGWQSGHAAACKAVYAGSIPTPASITLTVLYCLAYYFRAILFYSI